MNVTAENAAQRVWQRARLGDDEHLKLDILAETDAGNFTRQR
ncbi:hypothetical protein ACH4TV_47235 [Streptomyces sp. NPDC020898]